MPGFVMIPRDLFEHPKFNRGPFDAWHAFEYLYVNAVWKDCEILFHSKVTSLKRGQLLTSYRQLARDWKWGYEKVARGLSAMKLLGECEYSAPKTGQLFFIITITKYDTYNSGKIETAQQPCSDRAVTAQQPCTDQCRIEEGNKVIKKERNKKQPLPLSAAQTGFFEFWKAYPKGIRGKGSKKKAMDSWIRINPTPELFGKMARSIEDHRNSIRWKKDNGYYIPDVVTWLNQHRWEDEVVSTPPPINGPAYLSPMSME